MIRYRALGFSRECCCLPKPYRIPQRVAGMAFNFSKIEMTERTQRKPAASAEPGREQGSNERNGTTRFSFDMKSLFPAT